MIAWKLPRKIALFAFIRVASTGDSPDITYREAYDNWESGLGK